MEERKGGMSDAMVWALFLFGTKLLLGLSFTLHFCFRRVKQRETVDNFPKSQIEPKEREKGIIMA